MFAAMSMAEEVHSRTNAVRRLYRNFFAQNTREARGRRLLRNWLSPHQRDQLDEKNYFEVVGCDSQKRYRIYNRVTYGEMPTFTRSTTQVNLRWLGVSCRLAG